MCKKDASNGLCCTEILVQDLIFLVSCLIIPWFLDMNIPVTDLQSTSPYESVVTSSDEQRKKDKRISSKQQKYVTSLWKMQDENVGKQYIERSHNLPKCF